MSRMSRLLLLVILAVALPLQGMAASSRLHCVRAGTLPATVFTDAGMPAPCHGHGETVDPSGHGKAHAPASAASIEDAPGASDPESAHADAHAGCSSCALCCLGVGLPIATAPLLLTEFTCVHGRYAALPELTRTVGGLERPPRNFPA